MAITISERSTAATVVGDQCVVLGDIDWKGYSTMLRLRGERSVPKMIYLDGSLLLVSPTYVHEFLKKRLGAFVHEVVVGLNMPCTPTGSTTFRRRSKQAGVEGDETFYLGSAPRIQGKTVIDLRTDPPPDLAIEAVHTHDVRAAVQVYRRLRVPEVWICDGSQLQVLVRPANGRYLASDTSAAFPFLKTAEIFAWVMRPAPPSETEWYEDLRRWVRETLGPRRAAAQP